VQTEVRTDLRKLPVCALVGVAIFVIEEDCLTGIAARHHMMDRAGEFDAKRAGHAKDRSEAKEVWQGTRPDPEV